MTTLYRPVLIESAEQAEALPEATVAVHPDHWPREKFQSVWQECDGLWDNSAMVGWTALVPIEAEEETTHEMRTSRGVENFAPSHGILPVPSRRLVTPWEDA